MFLWVSIPPPLLHISSTTTTFVFLFWRGDSLVGLAQANSLLNCIKEDSDARARVTDGLDEKREMKLFFFFQIELKITVHLKKTHTHKSPNSPNCLCSFTDEILVQLSLLASFSYISWENTTQKQWLMKLFKIAWLNCFMLSQGIPFDLNFKVRFGLVQYYITVYAVRWGIKVGTLETFIKNNYPCTFANRYRKNPALISLGGSPEIVWMPEVALESRFRF